MKTISNFSITVAGGIYKFALICSVILFATQSIAQRNPKELIRFKLEGNGELDNAVVYFMNPATVGFDSKYDAYKFTNPGVNIYTTPVSGLNLTINAMPQIMTKMSLPLNIKVAKAGSYTITITDHENAGMYVDSYIYDAVTGNYTTVDVNSSITFNVNANEANSKLISRFSLEIADNNPNKGTVITDVNDSQAATFTSSVFPNPTNGEALHVTVATDATVEVTDINGRQVISEAVQGATYTQTIRGFETLENGIYLINIREANGNTTSSKIIKS